MPVNLSLFCTLSFLGESVPPLTEYSSFCLSCLLEQISSSGGVLHWWHCWSLPLQSHLWQILPHPLHQLLHCGNGLTLCSLQRLSPVGLLYCRCYWSSCLPARAVRYAKSLTIQFFIDISNFQNSL